MCLSQRHRSKFMLFTVIVIIGAAPLPAISASLSLEYSLGFNGRFQLHTWTPVTVVIENRGRAMRGILEVIVTSGSEYHQNVFQTTYAMDVDIPHNSKKRYAFTVFIESFTHEMVIRLKQDENIHISQSVDLRPHFSEKSFAVVADDLVSPDILAVLPKTIDPANVPPKFLPETWYGYDSVKLLVMKTDSIRRLREKQFQALARWIKQGGYLITAGSLNYGSLSDKRIQGILPIHVLGQRQIDKEKELSFEEFKLIVGIAQELGLSIENVRLYQEAQERERILAELLHQVVGAQEAERQRIARELHDATGQSLTAIALGLRGVETMLESNPPVAVEQVRELKSFSTDALGELRQIIADLRPSQLDDLGLVPALQWYVQEFEKRYAVRTEFVVEGTRSRLPPEYETVLFRITQEALSNVARHADASHASVELVINQAQVGMTIHDDGRGFDLEKTLRSDRRAGWGLLGIQERTLLLGGHYEIDSKPGRGTHIRVTVPLKMEAEDDEDQTVAG